MRQRRPDQEHSGPVQKLSFIIQRWLPLIRAIAGRAVSAGGVLTLSVILSRQLGLEAAGSFFTAYAAAMGLSILMQAGQPLLLIRKVAAGVQGTELFFKTLGNIVLIAIPCIALLIVWQIATGRGADPVGWIWVPLLPIAVIGQCASYLKGRGKPGAGGLLEVGLISTIATVYFYVSPANDALIAWGLFCAISWGVAIIALFGVFRVSHTAATVSAYAPKLIFEARILWLNSVLSYVSQWGGVLIVAATLSTDSVAILNAVFRLLAPIQFVVLTLDYFLAPKFAARGVQGYRHLRMLGVFACLGLIAPYLLMLTLIPERVLVGLYGDAFAGYGYTLQILAFGTFFQIILGANGIALNMWGQDKIALIGVLIRSAIATLGAALLIPVYGLTASVLAFAAAVIVQNGFYRYAVDRIAHNPTQKVV